MLPPFIYERLPSLYLLAAIAIITLSDQPLLWFAGALLFIAGAVTWMMRYRSDYLSEQTLATAGVAV